MEGRGLEDRGFRSRRGASLGSDAPVPDTPYVPEGEEWLCVWEWEAGARLASGEAGRESSLLEAAAVVVDGA